MQISAGILTVITGFSVTTIGTLFLIDCFKTPNWRSKCKLATGFSLVVLASGLLFLIGAVTSPEFVRLNVEQLGIKGLLLMTWVSFFLMVVALLVAIGFWKNARKKTEPA